MWRAGRQSSGQARNEIAKRRDVADVEQQSPKGSGSGRDARVRDRAAESEGATRLRVERHRFARAAGNGGDARRARRLIRRLPAAWRRRAAFARAEATCRRANLRDHFNAYAYNPPQTGGPGVVVFIGARRSFVYMRKTLLLLLLSASVAGAQGGQTGGSITGSVVDDNGQPVRDADVFAPPATARTRTDSTGHFAIASLPADFYHVRVRHIGFSAAEISTDLGKGGHVDLKFEMKRRPVLLDSVVVQVDGKCPPTQYSGFNCRRVHGKGVYLTDDDIMDHGAIELGDIFRDMDGFRIEQVMTRLGMHPKSDSNARQPLPQRAGERPRVRVDEPAAALRDRPDRDRDLSESSRRAARSISCTSRVRRSGNRRRAFRAIHRRIAARSPCTGRSSDRAPSARDVVAVLPFHAAAARDRASRDVEQHRKAERIGQRIPDRLSR